MDETIGKIASRLAKEGEKAEVFFRELPDSVWLEQVYTDGASWQVREVLAHLVEAERALPRLFRGIADGGAGVPQDFDLNEYNEQSVTNYAEKSPAELIRIFSDRRRETIDVVRSLTDDDLTKEGNHPFLGQAKLGEMIRLFYLHVQLHMRDIRSLSDER